MCSHQTITGILMHSKLLFSSIFHTKLMIACETASNFDGEDRIYGYCPFFVYENPVTGLDGLESS